MEILFKLSLIPKNFVVKINDPTKIKRLKNPKIKLAKNFANIILLTEILMVKVMQDDLSKISLLYLTVKNIIQIDKIIRARARKRIKNEVFLFSILKLLNL